LACDTWEFRILLFCADFSILIKICCRKLSTLFPKRMKLAVQLKNLSFKDDSMRNAYLPMYKFMSFSPHNTAYFVQSEQGSILTKTICTRSIPIVLSVCRFVSVNCINWVLLNMNCFKQLVTTLSVLLLFF
jgi:hypothetical protein